MTKPAPTWAYALTIFLSAFLLFQVQPLISRHILPWFGGSPAVWSAAMLFFQTALLGGYAYADWFARRTSTLELASPKKNKTGGTGVHLALLTLSVLVVLGGGLAWGAPLLPDAAWKPEDASLPLLRILVTLTGSVGLPYFILSTTSPLLQAWYARSHPGRSPYALYALSNAGSFLALISYPLLFEPLLDLRAQAALWTGGFIVYLILAAGLMRAAPLATQPSSLSFSEETGQNSTGYGTAFLWVLLPACSSTLLLAVTNQLTQEVAVIPFLWILPLSIYLLTYTLTFSGEGGYPRRVVIFLFGVCLLLLVYAQDHATQIGIFAQILAYGAFLLLANMALHGELYRLRPPAGRLTGFYLLSSLGSVLGGLFVNLGAPVLFPGYWELPISALLSWALIGGLLVYTSVSPRKEAGAAGVLSDSDSPTLSEPDSVGWRKIGLWTLLKTTLTGIGVLALLIFAGEHLNENMQAVLNGALVSERNFYGIYRVRAIEAGQPPAAAHGLAHGITWHGFQYTATERSRTPTAYYGVNSGIGLALTRFEQGKKNGSLSVGVIGLGTGTLAAYSQPGDRYRFYEINPGIIALAEGKGGLFSFLSGSSADIQIVAGDARLALEQELAAGQANQFDILAVDAFSSDSIPIHLLTSEAFDVYLAHLQPQGVLAIHISNRYLNLQPLVGALAAEHNLPAVVVASPPEDTGTYPAVWVLVTRNQDFLALPLMKARSKPIPTPDQPVRAWSDNYSNLIQVLRWDVVLKR